MFVIPVVNGPNLDCLEKRPSVHYGGRSFEAFLGGLRERYPHCIIPYVQSDEEGVLVRELKELSLSSEKVVGIILNAAAYSHTSVALRDTVELLALPVVEVHISNIYARETFRHKSLLSAVCQGTISGLGLYGYEAALRYLLERKGGE